MFVSGCSLDIVNKVATDYAEMICEDHSPIHRWIWKSSFAPMDISFKLDEEFEYLDPLMQEKAKITCTLSGNKMVTVNKYPTQTWISTYIITGNFMIIVS